MNLLALDISSVAVGVAIFQADELQELKTHKLAGENLYARLRRANQVIDIVLAQHMFSVLAIEGPSYGAHAKAMIAQQRIVGAILDHWISWTDGLIVEVPPATAKLTLCGSGKADKAQMVSAARLQLPGWTIDEHSADAYAVGLAGLGLARQHSYQEK